MRLVSCHTGTLNVSTVSNGPFGRTSRMVHNQPYWVKLGLLFVLDVPMRNLRPNMADFVPMM